MRRWRALKALRRPLVAGVFLLLGAWPGNADTPTDLERQIAQTAAHMKDASDLLRDRNVELFETEAFLRQVKVDWTYPWAVNEWKIGRLKAEIEALRRMGVFNQNSRDLNDRMRALLAERARLEKLDGQRIEDCTPPCTTMTGLQAAEATRTAKKQALAKEIADLDDWLNQLRDELEALKPRLADSRAAEKAVLQAQLDDLRTARARQAALLKPGESFLLPNLDGDGPPRVLSREDLIREVIGALLETGTSTDVGNAPFRTEVEALTRDLLRQSNALKRQIRDKTDRLDEDIAALEQRLGVSADDTPAPAAAATYGNCPPRNPAPGANSLTHRFPKGADRTYLSCSYFPAENGTAGPLKAQVSYEDGRESGIAANFSLDGGHHLDSITNRRGPQPRGADCRYHSASAIREYHLFGDDGSELIMYCEPDGTPGRCDYIAHDGRARNCRMPCTDQCADLRKAIGWLPMQ